jgi:hypothetical protein
LLCDGKNNTCKAVSEGARIEGQNECKGKSACKAFNTDANNCMSKNACKAQGVDMLDGAEDCYDLDCLLG